MTPLKEDPEKLLAKAEELGYTAFGPLMVAFSSWLAREARKQGVKRLYFLAREGHFLMEFFRAFLASGLSSNTDLDLRYLLISRRAVFGAVEKKRETLKPMLAVGPYEGSLHGLLQARMGIPLEASAKMRIPDLPVVLPDDSNVVLEELDDALEGLNDLAEPERDALSIYLNQEGFFDDGTMGLVDVGYSGSIQRWLGGLTHRPLVGFYFATTIVIKEWVTPDNAAVTCFGSDCSLTVTPPVYRYALGLESWLTAPAGQLVRFIDNNGRADPVFGEPGRMQQNFAFPSAVAAGVHRYLVDCAFLAAFDRDWEQNLHRLSQDILAAAMESPIFEDVLHAFSVEDAFCGHGEISIYEKMADLTSDVRLSEVTNYEGEVR